MDNGLLSLSYNIPDQSFHFILFPSFPPPPPPPLFLLYPFPFLPLFPPLISFYLSFLPLLFPPSLPPSHPSFLSPSLPPFSSSSLPPPLPHQLSLMQLQEEKERLFHENRASLDEVTRAKDHEIHSLQSQLQQKVKELQTKDEVCVITVFRVDHMLLC